MYSSIVEIVQNREFLDSVRKGWSYGSNIDLFSSLPSYKECLEFESGTDAHNNSNILIEFDKIFNEPLGYYLIKCFLMLNCSDDKAVFVSDVQLYKSLTDPSGRLHISKKIYMKYCSTGAKNKKEKQKYIRGVSVFETITSANRQQQQREIDKREEYKDKEMMDAQGYAAAAANTGAYMQLASESRTELNVSHAECRNAIDCYGDVIDECFHSIFIVHSSSLCIFDGIVESVLVDLRENVFPLFISSSLYRLYIQCMAMNVKSMAPNQITVEDFHTLRVLGRGAFGFVNAVIKKNTGHIYAMKCINKKRVMATDSVETIMSERNFLSDMNSNFVTGLKYAVMDDNTLYLIIDLMVGGDLKFHLNKEGRFNIERSRFYAAEVLLGLQHIHSKGIIYRDIKLENVLLDNRGHCKISDLGLAVRSKEKVRGYAGTPGYTAPEVCLQQSYGAKADFFSFGVMIYRFLSGRKPFQVKNKSKTKAKDAKNAKDGKKKGHRSGNELDKNVVEIEPEYPDRYFTPSARSLLKGLMCKNPEWRLADIDEIKNHAWFTTKIEFGLLESGHLNPPFIPNQDEINADSLRHIGRPPNDDKYKDVKCTKHFEKSLAKFPFCSPQVQQEEIVDVLKKIKKYYSFQHFINIIIPKNGRDASKEEDHREDNHNIITHKLADVPSKYELNKFAQAMRNQKEKYGVNAFIPQYYKKRNTVHTTNHQSQSIGHHYESGLEQYKLIVEKEEADLDADADLEQEEDIDDDTFIEDADGDDNHHRQTSSVSDTTNSSEKPNHHNNNIADIDDEMKRKDAVLSKHKHKQNNNMNNNNNNTQCLSCDIL